MQGDTAYGCGMMSGGMMGGGMMGAMLCGMADEYDWEMLTEELEITGDQKNRIMMENRNVVKNMMENGHALSMKMFDLNAELRQDEPQETRIDNLVDEIAAMQRQMLEQRVRAIRQMREVLNPDQWESFKHMPMMQGRGRMHMMR
jgi:hypothetical protein